MVWALTRVAALKEGKLKMMVPLVITGVYYIIGKTTKIAPVAHRYNTLMSNVEKYLKPEVIRTVGRLDLRAKFIVEGFLAGLHASPFHGFSVEFSEHRKYTPGE